MTKLFTKLKIAIANREAASAKLQPAYASKKQYRNGAAAIYIVIFTTILLSVITVSFIRIMTSDTMNTVNDDLSVSAYDSALAGVEDAKIALVKYHNCIDQNSTTGDCAFVTAMQTNIANGSCDTVSIALGRTDASNPQPVVIQETSSSSNAGDSSRMEQAYTCVKISEELSDYRGTLTNETRTTLVPLRTNTSDYGKVKALKIMWHAQDSTNKTALGNSLPSYNANLIPALTADIFQTSSTLNLGTLSARQGNQIDFASLLLRPSSYSSSTTQNPKTISRTEVLNIADKYYNEPFNVSCTNTTFLCTAIINLPVPVGNSSSDYVGSGADATTVRSASTFFLRLGLPYANASGTEFSVTMCKLTNCQDASGLDNDLVTNSNAIAPFVGVQAQVDSTGRANDIYRRVDARVELVETGFPYPEYAIWMAGSDQKDINKAYWVTNDCKIKVDSESDMEDCDDNKGDL